MYTLFQRRGRLKNVTNIHNFKREEILEEKTKKKEKTNHSIRECGWRIKTICPLMAVSSFVGR